MFIENVLNHSGPLNARKGDVIEAGGYRKYNFLIAYNISASIVIHLNSFQFFLIINVFFEVYRKLFKISTMYQIF